MIDVRDDREITNVPGVHGCGYVVCEWVVCQVRRAGMSECARVPKSARSLSLSSARRMSALYNDARITSEPHGCFKAFRRSCSGGPPPRCVLLRQHRGSCPASPAEEDPGDIPCSPDGAKYSAAVCAAQPAGPAGDLRRRKRLRKRYT